MLPELNLRDLAVAVGVPRAEQLLCRDVALRQVHAQLDDQRLPLPQLQQVGLLPVGLLEQRERLPRLLGACLEGLGRLGAYGDLGREVAQRLLQPRDRRAQLVELEHARAVVVKL
eukprot:1791012-Prymnesium_polylepis.1